MNSEQPEFYKAIIVVALLIGLIIAYFIFSIVRYHRRYVKLQKERIFAEITIQENERKRIAADLDNSIGPLLSAVKLNINSIKIEHSEDNSAITQSVKYLDEIIGSMREMSYNLLPGTLERKGLAEAAKEFISQVSQKSSMNIQFFVIKECKVPKEKEIHIFRMIQEILLNAVKHAKAKSLKIGLSEEQGNLLLFTKDDGIGFDVEKEQNNIKGLGLKSLQSRVEMLNGIYTLDSKLNEGTNYFIKIPLN